MKKILLFLAVILLLELCSAEEKNYFQSVQDNFLSGKFSEAIKISKIWKKEEPDNPIPYYFESYCQYEKNYLDDAVRNLLKAINMDKKAEKWLPVCERMVKENPGNVNALVALGDAYHRAGMYDRAINILEKVIKMKPDLGPAYYVLGVVYLRKKEAEKSQEIFTKGIEKAPSFLGNYQYAGLYYQMRREYSKAEKIYKEAIKRDKAKATGFFYNHLGDVYIKMKKYKKAIKVLEEGYKVRPNNFGLLLSLGDAYFGNGEKLKAKRIYEKAKEILEKEEKLKGKDYISEGALKFRFDWLKEGKLKK